MTLSGAPDEARLRRETDWASETFDPRVISRNNRSAFLGDYQPVVHYLSRRDFENLGDGFTPAEIPAWR